MPQWGQHTPLTSTPRAIRPDKPTATTVPRTQHTDLLLRRTSWTMHPAHPTHKYFETPGWKCVNSINIGKQTWNKSEI
ncbi:hypothetical protein CEXT_67361 [Caerostris extrusa]|uniref:Uncharacterized protein n=1 Tax=Caerostris extrusa TaxID=172846 RepID=A0AAV4NPZ7_CAEEX|nr:hypothetical protein CEXT_67361 [Caerostris extrusa]